MTYRKSLINVAPNTGAWIEIIFNGLEHDYLLKSHLTQVRGLKYVVKTQLAVGIIASHLTQVRGLKFLPLFPYLS